LEWECCHFLCSNNAGVGVDGTLATDKKLYRSIRVAQIAREELKLCDIQTRTTSTERYYRHVIIYRVENVSIHIEMSNKQMMMTFQYFQLRFSVWLISTQKLARCSFCYFCTDYNFALD
jgi:hypothetical protein